LATPGPHLHAGQVGSAGPPEHGSAFVVLVLVVAVVVVVVAVVPVSVIEVAVAVVVVAVVVAVRVVAVVEIVGLHTPHISLQVNCTSTAYPTNTSSGTEQSAKVKVLQLAGSGIPLHTGVVVVVAEIVVVVAVCVVVVDVVGTHFRHVTGHSRSMTLRTTAFSHSSARSAQFSGSGSPLQTGVVVLDVADVLVAVVELPVVLVAVVRVEVVRVVVVVGEVVGVVVVVGVLVAEVVNVVVPVEVGVMQTHCRRKRSCPRTLQPNA
jgi:hypothetical protein